MKKILIALALLAPLPAAADTIIYNTNPDFLSAYYPAFYSDLVEANFYAPMIYASWCDSECQEYAQYQYPLIMAETVAFVKWEEGFPVGTTFVYGAVPEPSTWALLLFGFAFFAIKGIWPARKPR